MTSTGRHTDVLASLAGELSAAEAALDAARERQRSACLAALSDGCPVSAVARDANVTRATLHAWQRAAGQR